MGEFIGAGSGRSNMSKTKYKKMLKKMEASYEKADEIAEKSKIVAEGEMKQAENDLDELLKDM